MIRFTCPCGKQVQVHDQEAGQSVSCPACGKHLVVDLHPPHEAS
jgi:DNA-directed RNA polymerase subunit RPC12/RpoP